MRRYTKIGACAIAALSLTGLACKQEPVPGRVALGGDSLSFQAGWYAGLPPEWDINQKVGIGWQAEHVQPQASADVENPELSAAIFVIALGQNDVATSAGRDGFTQEDRDQILALAQTPHDSACVAFVKPWYQPPAGAPVDQTHVEGIAAYRDLVDLIVASNPTRYRSVDWKPLAQAHPEYLDPDGIHLTTTPEAGGGTTAYRALLEAAAAACG